MLAKNLLVARVVAGFTQQGLAEASRISRATIAQLEAGYSDPRLSTIDQLAKALGIPAILLLMGKPEIEAISALRQQLEEGAMISARDVQQMRQLVATGMLRDRLRAAVLGGDAVRTAGDPSHLIPISAAIFSAAQPGDGTHVGLLLGRLLAGAAGG